MKRQYIGPTGRIYTFENVREDYITVEGNLDPWWIATGPGGVYVEGRSFGKVFKAIADEWGPLRKREA